MITFTFSRCPLLLELLIAIALLSLGTIGLVETPMLLHKKNMARLEHVENDRIAACTFVEIRSRLRWFDIPAFREKSEPFVLTETQSELLSKTIHRSYTLKTLAEKIEPSGHTYRLMAVAIDVGKQTFTYRLIVEPIAKVSGS